jgi:hypothetical protein
MVDSMTVKLTREEVKAIQQKVAQMDKTILERSLGIDLSPALNAAQVFTSTEDTKTVLDKLRAAMAAPVAESDAEVSTSKTSKVHRVKKTDEKETSEVK